MRVSGAWKGLRYQPYCESIRYGRGGQVAFRWPSTGYRLETCHVGRQRGIPDDLQLPPSVKRRELAFLPIFLYYAHGRVLNLEISRPILSAIMRMVRLAHLEPH